MRTSFCSVVGLSLSLRASIIITILYTKGMSSLYNIEKSTNIFSEEEVAFLKGEYVDGIMRTLSYEGLQFYYANDCKLCRGAQSIVDADDIRRECLCQKLARQKWRLEQVKIRPNYLKYKDWEDFNGTIEANGEIVGNLTIESALSGRDKAFRYCFGSSFDSKLLKNKSSHLYVQKHVLDGQNIIIQPPPD